VNAQQFQILKAGELKVGKNQIYYDENSSSNPSFIVEKYEWEENGVPMYSVVDSFFDFETAMKAAKNPRSYGR